MKNNCFQCDVLLPLYEERIDKLKSEVRDLRCTMQSDHPASRSHHVSLYNEHRRMEVEIRFLNNKIEQLQRDYTTIANLYAKLVFKEKTESQEQVQECGDQSASVGGTQGSQD